MHDLKPVSVDRRSQLRGLTHTERCTPKMDHPCRPNGRSRGNANTVTKDAIQDLQIKALKQELAGVRKLLEMVLVLVDPSDVAAALDLVQTTPPNAILRTLVQPSDSPDEHFEDEDERPW